MSKTFVQSAQNSSVPQTHKTAAAADCSTTNQTSQTSRPYWRLLVRLKNCNIFFLPKFHCELNFIEQCWGYAKRIYRLNPASSREDQLEKNTLAALEAVLLKSMCKFANFSHRFMDAYSVLPEGIMLELDRKGVIIILFKRTMFTCSCLFRQT